jgi:hypothetical protein
LAGVFSVGAVLSTAGACSHNAYEAAGDVAPANMIGVHVQNNNFLDVTVYAVASGMPTRLGTVTGNSVHDFVIPPSLATRDFRIVADPIGGSGTASTGSIQVGPGQTVDFTIGSILTNSTVFIR